MSDLDPSTQPRVPSLPALVETLPAHPAASPESTFTRERQVAFLHALAATGAVRAAAARAGVSHQTAYRERLASAVFRRAWDAALLAARCHAEETLAVRAIEGVEEQVWYHGEVVATRRRYDARLLLAHLARLDRLTSDAKVEAFAGDFEGALGRFGEGSETPEKASKKKSPGQWSKRSTASAPKAPQECPECGGKCLGPEDALTEADCRWLGNRLERMDWARPRGVREPHEFTGYEPGAVEAQQLAAFEAGEDDWWLIVPPGPGDDPNDWHFAADDPPIEYKSLGGGAPCPSTTGPCGPAVPLPEQARGGFSWACQDPPPACLGEGDHPQDGGGVLRSPSTPPTAPTARSCVAADGGAFCAGC